MHKFSNIQKLHGREWNLIFLRVLSFFKTIFYPLESMSLLTGAVLIQMDLIVGSENAMASSIDILNSANTLTTKKLKKSKKDYLLTIMCMTNFWIR